MPIRRAASSVVALVLLLLAAAGTGTASAATLDAQAETAFLADINRERTSRGLAPLGLAPDIVSVARTHSVRMADSNHLHHNPNLATEVKGWLSLAENVGYGGSEASVHTALMNSAGHRANILNAAFSQVGLGAVRDAGGRLWVTQVFRAPDATTARLTLAPSEPLPPPSSEPLPPMTTSAGAARLGSVVLLADRASTGAVTVRPVTDSYLAAPTGLGGVAQGPAAVAADRDGRVDVVVRGSDDGVWWRNQPGPSTGFSAWGPLGGVATSRPAAASWGPGRLDVVVRGLDGAVWHRAQFSPGHWSPWATLGGQLAAGTGPALTASEADALTVVATGTDGQVWTRSYRPGGWGGWTAQGGVVVGDPSAASPGPGQVVIAVKGTDGAGWARSLTGGWVRLGGVLTHSPAAAAGAGRVDVFGVGTDAGLYRTVLEGSSWRPWARVS